MGSQKTSILTNTFLIRITGLKLCFPILNSNLEGTVSQIFYSGLSSYFIPKIGKLFE